MSEPTKSERKAGPVLRDAKGRLLKGSVLPTPGRPSGKGLVTMIRSATNDGEELVAGLLRIVRGEERCTGADKLRAYEMLLQRAWGKAPEIQLTGELSDDHAAALAEVNAGELIDLVRHLRSEQKPPSLLTVDSVATSLATEPESIEPIQSESLEDS